MDSMSNTPASQPNEDIHELPPNSPPYSTTLPLNHSLPPSSPPSTVNPPQTISPSFNPNPPRFDEGPKVPRPISFKLIAPSTRNINRNGNLKIYIPTFGVILVKPPRQNDLLPNEDFTFKGKDAILSGTLEISSDTRCKVKSIMIGVQTISHLNMGLKRGWEDDAVFERVVKISKDQNSNRNISGEEEEGIWLDKGAQSFSFSIHLPSTIATSEDFHFGAIMHMITAKVEGQPIPEIPTAFSSFTSIFSKANPWAAGEESLACDPKLPYVKAVENVMIASIASLNKDENEGRLRSLSQVSASSANDDTLNRHFDGVSTHQHAEENGNHSTHTRRSNTSPPTTPPPLVRPSLNSRQRSTSSTSSTSKSPPSGILQRITSGPKQLNKEDIDVENWMKGDLYISRKLIVHANPSQSGDVTQLDFRKDGAVDGLGSFRYNVTSDVFTVSSVLLLSLSIPSPSSACTIFSTRLILTQSYAIVSPRTPDLPPYQPASTKQHVLYQIGQLPVKGDKYPGKDTPAIWRGKEVGGHMNMEGEVEDAWKIRKVVRLPDHDNMSPSTLDGTITPIGVKHEFILQVFYSIHGETTTGSSIEGPGECRTLSVKMPILIPSCGLTVNALNLPTYETAPKSPSTTEEMKTIFQSSWEKYHCMCGYSFEELGKEAMKRIQVSDAQLNESESVEERLNRVKNENEFVREEGVSGS